MHNSYDLALRCVRCGFCLDSCPTFRLTGNEADSPRGRIYMMRSVMDGEIEFDCNVREHLDSCLGCRACETACPSGVQYGSLIEQFRSRIESEGIRSPGSSFVRKSMVNIMSSAQAMSIASKLSASAKAVTGSEPGLPQFVQNMITGEPGASISLPSLIRESSNEQLKPFYPAEGKPRHRVAILAGCVMRSMFQNTNLATIRVLQKNGCDVIVPPSLGCCGALHLHSGFEDTGIEKARAFLRSAANSEFDTFIVNSAGCGSTLKEYNRLFAEDPGFNDMAIEFSAKVKDVCEFLSDIGLKPPTKQLNMTVAYHDACHLAHGQKITRQPREVLQSIPGITLVDLPESDTCCGSAGTYNVYQPEMAKRLQQRKLDFILSTGAEVVATGNPGCLAWIEAGMNLRSIEMRIAHPIDLLNEAYL